MRRSALTSALFSSSLAALAAAGKLAEIQRALAAAPGRVNEVNEYGQTSLMMAAGKGNLRMVNELLSTKGIDVHLVDKLGATACHYAASYGHDAILRALAERGADVNKLNDDGVTPLQLASHGGHESAAR